jgi:tungstate transport system substrate-binding protein
VSLTRRAVAIAGLVTTWVASAGLHAQESFIVLASTTSTEQSGLFGHILPRFKAATGITVRVVALGTGQALDIARRGDADVVLVHDREAEERFVAEGFARERLDVMYNDFVVIGPREDQAGVAGLRDAALAFTRIRERGVNFVSRGDRSGTHAAELRIWRRAGIDIAATKPAWYRETGSGMGPALNTAASLGAYVLADRGTWLNFRNRRDLAVLVEGDRELFNPYGVMIVNPARHAHVKAREANLFVQWLLSSAGQEAIASFRIEGETLFFPVATPRRGS